LLFRATVGVELVKVKLVRGARHVPQPMIEGEQARAVLEAKDTNRRPSSPRAGACGIRTVKELAKVVVSVTDTVADGGALSIVVVDGPNGGLELRCVTPCDAG
jgi:hypothetical protein